MTLDELKSALADRIEPLALELLQAAPTTRARDEIRFGRKGALAVRVAGPKRGTFCDYSGSAKGDALALRLVVTPHRFHQSRLRPPQARLRVARLIWPGACGAKHYRRAGRLRNGISPAEGLPWKTPRRCDFIPDAGATKTTARPALPCWRL